MSAKKPSVEVVRQASIIEQLRGLIVSGKAAPGYHLQEVALSRLLGVSRTPIREALVALEREGLVVYRPNRGYVVREFNLSQILDANFVREVLESAACRLVAEEGPDAKTTKALSRCIEQGKQLLSSDARDSAFVMSWREMNARFHQAIMDATHNEFLLENAARVLAIPLISMRVVYWFESAHSGQAGEPAPDIMDDWHLRRSHDDHQRLVDAMLSRQGTRAEAIMREHIHAGSEILRAQYQRYFDGSAANGAGSAAA